MGNSWGTVATLDLASTKTTLRIRPVNSEYTWHVNVEDVLRVITGKKKTATIYVLRNNPRPRYRKY